MFKNIVEDAVSARVARIMEEEHCCTCERCKMDVSAIALNQLPPKYVVSPEWAIIQMLNNYQSQNSVEIYMAILKGVEAVKKNPRH